jgi:iron complex transport system permease protein
VIQAYLKNERRKRFYALLLLGGILVGSLLYLATGVVDISLVEGIRILLRRLPFPVGLIDADSLNEAKITVIELIRLPRILAGLIVGSGLAITGAAYQGLFKNRLADPFVTGISAGATFGCTVAILLGFQGGIFGLGGITLFAFAGALLTSFGIFLLIGMMKRMSSVTILLIGISVNLFLSSVVAFLMFINRNKIESIVLWTMGSVATVTWNKLLFALPLYLIGVFGLFTCARPLDILILGSDIAKVHGVNARRYNFLIILFSSLVTSVCVSLSGIIGFVGLVTPNMARLVFGFKHNTLFVFSLLFGAAFFIFADFLAKTLLSPAEIPVGIITSIIGVPFFLFLIFKNAKRLS